MKELIRNFLQRFGYDIIKTGVPYIPKPKKSGAVKVGKFLIEMPANNIQLVNYQLYPELNIQFGRLAASIAKKYPGMTVIDVGANVGDTIAVIKSAVEVPVFGVEGDDTSFEFLEKNAKQFSNVTVVKTFLGEKSEQTKVSMEKSGWNNTIIPDETGAKQIVFKTLDEVVEENNMDKAQLKLLKVDVEGFDTIVLRGALSVIRKNRPVLFFEYNRANMIAIREDGLSTVFSFLEMGYQTIAFFDHKGTLVLATDLQNKEEVTYMHDYISSPRNLLGYYDICIFHEEDGDLAEDFLQQEKNYV